MTRGFAAILVRISVRFAWVVALAAILLGVAAGHFAARHFALDSSTDNLVSASAPWRLNEQRFDTAFPQLNDLIVVVVDAASPERDAQATAQLTARLQAGKRYFLSVRQPQGDPFFAREGLLLLPPAEVRSTMTQIIRAQPFLGALAADPSLRGLMTSLSNALIGIQYHQATFADLSGPLSALTTTLGDIEAGKPASLSWRAMVTGGKSDPRETRSFIMVKPRLDYDALTPGTAASEAIRADAAALGLTSQNGVRVRLTGPVAMSDEEFATLADHAALLGALTLAGMTLMLWFAVRSARIIAAIVVTLLIGLAVTTAGGLAVLGPFNVISVAFIPLFVGLGVDFGIQFSVRYRAERHDGGDLKDALRRAGASIGSALMLAAMAIAAGFLSFAPTGYAGLAKLGMIAGGGMLVTFVLSLTCLPALLALMKPGGESAEIGFSWLAGLNRFVTRRYRIVLPVAGLLALIGAGLLFGLRFDFNPLDLRSAKTESVATALDLMKDPDTSPNTIDLLAPNQEAAKALAARLSRLPQVAGVLSIDTFVPDDQDAKLAAISDASFLLDTTINPPSTAPPPSDAEVVTALRTTAAALRKTASASPGAGAEKAVQLAGKLEMLAAGAPALRMRASVALLPGLYVMLGEIRAILQAKRITFDMLPRDLVRDWVTPRGAYRLEVLPRGDVSSNAALARFSAAVTAVAPDATGAPIVIQESGRTIVAAFINAGLLSFAAITVLLVLWLRRWVDVAFALVPLVFAFVLTLATSEALGMPLNFANIVALPLLFGIGVAFDIYFVMAWRSGARDLLQSPLGRAVILSAATTACGFGTLAFSSHPGTASMGVLLLISLAWILAVVLVLLPALLAAFDQRAEKPIS